MKMNCEAEDCVQHNGNKNICMLDIENISILEGGECSEYFSKARVNGEEETL